MLKNQRPPANIQDSPISPANDPITAVVEVVPFLVGLLMLAVALAAIIILALVEPIWLDALIRSMTGPKTAWYLTRASALVSYALLWWSMALGLAITNRMARAWPGGPTVCDLHEHASLLGLGFALVHALSLLGDQYIGYSLGQILVPFSNTAYRPLWVGIGQISMYLMVAVTLSFYVRQQIGTRMWRLIHYLSFAGFGLALAHGIWSGTDSAAGWATWMYTASGLSLVGLTIYRVLVTMQASQRRSQPKSR
jgi:predicted ferric reductase